MHPLMVFCERGGAAGEDAADGGVLVALRLILHHIFYLLVIHQTRFVPSDAMAII